MSPFFSYKDDIKKLLPNIIACPVLHTKWLNTLSFLENCGARKIAGCEHPTLVKEEMLKHAAEEFRHAHYLKKQMSRVSGPYEDYSIPFLLGGISTLHYLTALDNKTSRFLSQTASLPKRKVQEAAYVLVTYAIELRAEELYPLYEEYLRSSQSKVTVKSILLEEKEHLEEMRQGIDQLSFGSAYAEVVCRFEAELCKKWLDHVAQDIDSKKWPYSPFFGQNTAKI